MGAASLDLQILMIPALHASLRNALQARQRAASTLRVLHAPFTLPAMAKRKLSSTAGVISLTAGAPAMERTTMRRQSSRRGTAAATMNPERNPEIIDGVAALRASPDGQEDPILDSALQPSSINNSANVATAEINVKRRKTGASHVKVEAETGSMGPVKDDVANVAEPAGNAGVNGGLEGEDGLGEEYEDEAEFKEALSRPPPVNSEYLPLPWKGRLGYACLNTYLRNANPPVFSSRTCRIASIIEHRHPLKDPSQPEHATKNRPDKNQPPEIARGQRYVEELGLANARDVAKMVLWNDKYGIKFMRLSSEMFPFASHEEYGYKLAPFAAETLQEVGKVIGKLGHRVTTHPGQFTQLGSPRMQVIDNAVRDLEYHDEMLSLLKLPEQQNRDAVMILHLGGAYGDKPAAIARFKENYAKLSQGVKNRLVLENDDVVWCVHELLPLCQELNIPFVLDYHHHNILFDETQIREGTKDIMDLYPAILETWKRKGITPKMHYSEPTPSAITRTSRRKHSPRVMTLPPCPDTMDLMIEAKDKEQAVFELMRTFKLPGFHTFNDVLPHTRHDENKPWKPKPDKAAKKSMKTIRSLDNTERNEEEDAEDAPPPIIPEEEVSMGGPEGRVYWPPGMEDWLRPPRRVLKKKEEGTLIRKNRKTTSVPDNVLVTSDAPGSVKTSAKKSVAKPAASSSKKKKPKSAPPPSVSDEEDDQLSSPPSIDSASEAEAPAAEKRTVRPAATRKKSGRAKARVSYKEEEADEISL